MFFFFKQKTAYEMRISDWSSDVCSSDLVKDGNQRVDLRRAGGVLHDHDRLPPFFFLRVADAPIHHARARVDSAAVELAAAGDEIGRASCRERVCQYV